MFIYFLIDFSHFGKYIGDVHIPRDQFSDENTKKNVLSGALEL